MWLMKKQTSLGNLGFPSLVHVKAGLLSDFWSISMSPYLVGGFNPSEKYESQLGWFFPTHGKSYNSMVPNHQPAMVAEMP